MAVQRQACFEPQRVPSPEPAGHRSALEKFVPQENRVRVGAEDFVAVLAGVPGPGDPAGFAKHSLPRNMKRRQAGIQELPGLRPLQCECCSLITLVGDRQMLAEPGKIAGNIPGVHDQQEN